jgi:predicted HicB family RNase H-like nuclease
MGMMHKGYTGSVEYDPEHRIFHGRVHDLSDVITFQGASVEELETDFREAVDDYLAFCVEEGIEPQRPHSGRFVLRLEPAVHGRVSAAARSAKTSLNRWIADAIQMRLDAESASRGTHVEDRLSDAAGG